jgi:OOP family OmpA-OmpF porin
MTSITQLSSKLIVASAVSLMALAAQAQSVQPGPYIGGSVGTTKFHGDNIGGFDTDTTDTGGKLYGGYQFTPNFSLEGGWVGLGKYSSSGSELKLNNGIFLDAVGTFPVAQDFSLLGRVGVYNGKADRTVNGVNDSERGTDIKYGAGVQYDLSKNTAIRGEWERYRVKALDIKDNTDMFSVGVNYRF